MLGGVDNAAAKLKSRQNVSLGNNTKRQVGIDPPLSRVRLSQNIRQEMQA